MSKMVVALGLVGVVVSAASAAVLPAGGYGPAVIVDPTTDAFNDPSDWYEITNVYFTSDATNYYFRIDVGAAGETGVDTFTFDEFGIYIDADQNAATGAQPSTGGTPGSGYIPDVLQGIEYIIDTHWDNGGKDWGNKHLHAHTGNDVFSTDGAPLTVIRQTTENGGTSLELQIAKTFLPAGPWTIYAATQDSVNGDTSDVTTSAAVPEPATMSLLALGGIGILVRRRRKA